jgi:hypothetical protein
LTPLTARGAFDDRTPLLFISQNKAFQKAALPEQQIFSGHDSTIRTAPKTFRTEVLFIDSLENIVTLWTNNFNTKFHYEGLIVLLLDGHASHVTPRVMAFAGANRIFIIKPVPHSSRISQPLDLCVFGLFKILYNKENKLKRMKGETLKIFRAVMAFSKPTRIPIGRWGFNPQGWGSIPRIFSPV